MADDQRDTFVWQILDGAVRGLEPSPGPRLAEILHRGSRHRHQWWVVSAAAVAAVLVAGLGWVVSDLTGSGQPAPSARVQSPSPTRATTSSPAGARSCPLATTRGDFDGDGIPDRATLVVMAKAGQSCQRAEVPQPRPVFRLQVRFGSGRHWDRRFRYCGAGQCAGTVFTATDLDGDGRAELAVDLGPGAAIDEVGFFRIDPRGFRPLRIAAGARLRAVGLQAGPAILGGGFDSSVQSPVRCRLRPDGTRVLVATQAELNGANIHGPWRVTRLVLRLRGDTFHAVRVTKTTKRGFPITGAAFDVHCP